MLVQEDPEQAVKRFESNFYAVNDVIIKHYIAALVKTNGLKSADLSSVLEHYAIAMPQSTFVNATTQRRPPVAPPMGSGSGSRFQSGDSDEPLVVAIQVSGYRCVMSILILYAVDLSVFSSY